MLRPLAPPSVDMFPAAAEAKLEVKGEGMIVVWKWQILDQEISQCSKLSKLFVVEGLAGGGGNWW